MKTLKKNISEAYRVKFDCVKDLETDPQDINGMKENVNNLVRLHKAMQEKLKQHHIKNKCTLLPWLLIYGLECTVQNILMLLNTLFDFHMKPKKQILKSEKTITTETLTFDIHLVTNVYQDENFRRQVPEKKDYVNVSKRVHKQQFCNLQKSVTCKNDILLSKKDTNKNIVLEKFCTLRPKWCVLAGSKMTHSVCVCNANQNVVLVVHAMN